MVHVDEALEVLLGFLAHTALMANDGQRIDEFGILGIGLYQLGELMAGFFEIKAGQYAGILMAQASVFWLLVEQAGEALKSLLGAIKLMQQFGFQNGGTDKLFVVFKGLASELERLLRFVAVGRVGPDR